MSSVLMCSGNITGAFETTPTCTGTWLTQDVVDFRQSIYNEIIADPSLIGFETLNPNEFNDVDPELFALGFTAVMTLWAIGVGVGLAVGMIRKLRV